VASDLGRAGETESTDAVIMTVAFQHMTEPDPWSDYDATKQNLTAAALHALVVAI
jgi:hypothetical protein